MSAHAAPLPVTDAHLHLWDLGASPYAWLAGAPALLRRTVTIEDVRADLCALGVTRVILVQADDTMQDTAHLQATARAIEAHAAETGAGIDRADVVGWLPLTDPDTVRAALARMRDEGLVRAVGVGSKDAGVLLRAVRTGQIGRAHV